MDEDEDGGLTSGISGGAGYILGRMAAESDQRMANFTRRVFSPTPPRRRRYDAEEVHEVIDGWKAAVRSRDATIVQLRTNNAALTAERDQLHIRNAQMESEAARMQAACAELQKREEAANKHWDEAAEAGHKDDFDLFLARQEIARLTVQIERLTRGEN